jgi:NTE family protein
MKIGLALGGGGARGAAHIGVLIELARLQIRPHLITGTSIGGTIGALAAAGVSPEEMVDFFKSMGPSKMYTLPGSAPALAGTGKIEKLLEETIGRPTFKELKIPFSVVTADLISHQAVILDQGDVISAVLATMALPILFPPVEQDGLVLVDGGILNNVPFDVARARGATYTVAVDLSNTAPYGTPGEPAPPSTGVVARALAITQRRQTWQVLSEVVDIITARSLNAHLAVAQPDILLRPYLGSISLFDFHRREEGIEAGRKAVLEVEEQLSKINK